jgi:exonuclease III
MNEDLSIISWNVRGLNDAAHRELARETTLSARPTIVCLQETKVSSMNLSIRMETLGSRLSGHCTLDANGTRGGILLAWDEEVVELTSVDIRQFTITATVRLLLTNVNFRLTTCYGPAIDRRKEEFLQEMISIKPPLGLPWLIMGDFNLIYKADDKNNLNLN